MTETKRKKWTAADLFLILLAVLSLVGFLVRFWGIRRHGEGDLRDYTLTVLWKSVDARTVDAIAEGDPLYTASGELFGYVISVQGQSTEVEMRQDGEVHRIASPTRLDARIGIAAKGREADGQILSTDGGALLIGQTLTLYSPTAELHVRIASIDQNAPL